MYRCGSGCRVCPWFLVNCRIHWTSGAVTFCSPQSLQFESVCDCVGSVFFRVRFCVSVFVSSLVCTCPKVCVWQPRQNETGNPRDNRLRWPDARRHESEMKNTRKDTRKTKFVMRCETRWDKRWDEEDEHEREIVRYVDVCWCVCWWCVVVCVCLSVWVRRQKRQTQQEGDRKVTFLTPWEIEKETCFVVRIFSFREMKTDFPEGPVGDFIGTFRTRPPRIEKESIMTVSRGAKNQDYKLFSRIMSWSDQWLELKYSNLQEHWWLKCKYRDSNQEIRSGSVYHEGLNSTHCNFFRQRLIIKILKLRHHSSRQAAGAREHRYQVDIRLSEIKLRQSQSSCQLASDNEFGNWFQQKALTKRVVNS